MASACAPQQNLSGHGATWKRPAGLCVYVCGHMDSKAVRFALAFLRKRSRLTDIDVASAT